MCFAASEGFGSVSQEFWADERGAALIMGLQALQGYSLIAYRRQQAELTVILHSKSGHTHLAIFKRHLLICFPE